MSIPTKYQLLGGERIALCGEDFLTADICTAPAWAKRDGYVCLKESCGWCNTRSTYDFFRAVHRQLVTDFLNGPIVGARFDK